MIFSVNSTHRGIGGPNFDFQKRRGSTVKCPKMCQAICYFPFRTSVSTAHFPQSQMGLSYDVNKEERKPNVMTPLDGPSSPFLNLYGLATFYSAPLIPSLFSNILFDFFPPRSHVSRHREDSLPPRALEDRAS